MNVTSYVAHVELPPSCAFVLSPIVRECVGELDGKLASLPRSRPRMALQPMSYTITPRWVGICGRLYPIYVKTSNLSNSCKMSTSGSLYTELIATPEEVRQLFIGSDIDGELVSNEFSRLRGIEIPRTLFEIYQAPVISNIGHMVINGRFSDDLQHGLFINPRLNTLRGEELVDDDVWGMIHEFLSTTMKT